MIRKHFEYYIDDYDKMSENTILYGKAIMIAGLPRSENRVPDSYKFTDLQKEVFFYKDTMSYKDLGKKHNQSFQSIHNVHKLALKKLNKIVTKLSENRSFFEPYS